MRAVPLLAALSVTLAAAPARPGSTEPTLPPALPDARPVAPPVLRPGQRGVVTPLGAKAGAWTWDLHLRRGDRVALEAAGTGAFTLEAAPAPDDANGTPAREVPAAASPGQGDGHGAWQARLELESRRKATWRVVLRSGGEAPVSHDLSVRCLSGPSCKGQAPADCGPDGHPWWLRTPARLLSDPTRFEGHPVRVRAKVRADLPRCTARACPLSSCCNTCVAPLVTGPAGLRGIPGMKDAGLRLEGLTCRGPDCAWREACPFAPGSKVTAWGHVHADDQGSRLEVHGACGPLPRSAAP